MSIRSLVDRRAAARAGPAAASASRRVPRVVYRPLTGPELKALRAAEAAGFLVERIVDRRDLEKAAATLPS
jgi:hypothetical protein